MITSDPNVQSVELVAHALGNLCDELILVGGCAASLLIDAPTAPPPRITYDVDLLAIVTALRCYQARFYARHVAGRPHLPMADWRHSGGFDAHR